MSVETESVPVPSWVRYGGMALLIGALIEIGMTLFVGVVFPDALVAGTRDAAIVADIVITYLFLGIIGVIALYVRYHESFGWSARLGLYLIAIGAIIGILTLISTGSMAGDIPLIGVIYGDVVTTYLPSVLVNQALVFGGAALLAIGLWRTPRIPRSAAILMASSPVAAAMSIVGFSLFPESVVGPIGYLLLSGVWGGAWIILGYHLWQQ